MLKNSLSIVFVILLGAVAGFFLGYLILGRLDGSLLQLSLIFGDTDLLAAGMDRILTRAHEARTNILLTTISGAAIGLAFGIAFPAMGPKGKKKSLSMPDPVFNAEEIESPKDIQEEAEETPAEQERKTVSPPISQEVHKEETSEVLEETLLEKVLNPTPELEKENALPIETKETSAEEPNEQQREESETPDPTEISGWVGSSYSNSKSVEKTNNEFPEEFAEEVREENLEDASSDEEHVQQKQIDNWLDRTEIENLPEEERNSIDAFGPKAEELEELRRQGVDVSTKKDVKYNLSEIQGKDQDSDS